MGVNKNNIKQMDSPLRTEKKTIYKLSQEYVKEGQEEERLSPLKNKFLKEDWPLPNKHFLDRLTQCKAHIDHTMTSELAKFQSRIWDLQTENDSIKQTVNRLMTEKDQEKNNLFSEVQTYKDLLSKCEKEKVEALHKRNEAVKLEIERILAGHQEAIVYYEMQKEEMERQLAARDQKIQELHGQLSGSKGSGQQLQQEKKELNEQLAHSNEIKDQLRDTIKRNQDNFNKELSQTRDHYEDKIETLNNEKSRQALEHAKEMENQKNLDRLDKENLVQSYEAKLDSLHAMSSAKAQDLTKQIMKNEEDLKHSLAVIGDYEKEVSLLKSQLTQANTQIQRRTQDLRDLDRQYSSLLKDYDTLNKEKQLANTDCTRAQAELDRNKHLAAGLRDEVESLKDVLVESSMEMERCRDELIKGERDREVIRLERDEAEVRIDKLERLLSDRQKEAERWRDNYYAVRNKY